MNSHLTHLTIAGGGLAGLSLACALRARGLAVTVLEAGSYPRHRVCGEFISGVTEETLTNLGILDLFASAHRHRSLAWHDERRIIHRDTFPQAAYGISRYRLDELLRKRLLESGGRLETGVRARRDPREGFVWAAGRKAQPGQWIGLKAHLRGIPRTADLEMHMGSNGYSGLAEVEDGWVNVCGIYRLDKKIPAKGPDLVAAYLDAGGNHTLAHHIRSAEWRDGSFSAVAGFELGRQPQLPGLLCIGDSESMIPPFTGNGMSMAFEAAETATDPLMSWAAGDSTWEQAHDMISKKLHARFTRRLTVASAMHAMLLNHSGRRLLKTLAGTRMLPFRPLLSLIR